ncbi:hypothetical protein IGI04_030216 [Brassica rapa subsp. trilocularis]|uniref:F-box associated domain-containing protein n=1 Tax=Brassica rapa subsp. trilocularis TaxID=1813537 RepID=A0ABQ7LST1_BRACM|nr:hypothetical protein IGI04_030216 [Brassica rapa subsp. trilocularis]
MKLVTKLGLEKALLLNPKCRVWCLDIDRWYLCTSIDINLHLSRHFLISIVSTDAHRSIHKYKVNTLPWEYRSHDARISDRISDQDWTGFHESKLNGGCHQSSLRKRALKIAASKSRFELFYLSLYESSLNGVTFQTCLKNPIPCIPSPKTSGYVRFSVGNQLWLLHTVQGKITLLRQCDPVFHLLSDLMKHSPNVLLSYLCFSEEHPQPVCEVSFIKRFFDWDSEDSFSETIHLLIVSFPLKILVNYLKGWVLVRVGLLMGCLSIDGRCVVTIDVGLTLSIDGWLNRSIDFIIERGGWVRMLSCKFFMS